MGPSVLYDSRTAQLHERTFSDNWEEVCRCPISIDSITKPRILTSCGHVLDADSITQLYTYSNTPKCPLCRDSITRYVESRQIKALLEEGNALVAKITQLISTRDDLKQKFSGEVRHNNQIHQIASKKYEMLIPCDHIRESKIFSKWTLVNRIWKALFSQNCQEPGCQQKIQGCISVPKMDEYVQGVAQLKMQADLLEAEIQFFTNPTHNSLSPQPTLSLPRTNHNSLPHQPIRQLPSIEQNIRDNVYSGGRTSQFVCSRPWTPLDQVELAKDAPQVRRMAFKNTNGNAAFLSYIRVNGYEDGRIEIFLSSVHSIAFEAYLRSIGLQPDAAESARRTTLNFGDKAAMGVFVARTQPELEWALRFISQQSLLQEHGIFPEQEHAFLTQLVESSANWRAVEGNLKHRKFIDEGTEQYLCNRSKVLKETLTSERLRIQEEMKTSLPGAPSYTPHVSSSSNRPSSANRSSTLKTLGYGVAVLAAGIFGALYLDQKQARPFVSMKSLRNLTTYIREGFRRLVY